MRSRSYIHVVARLHIMNRFPALDDRLAPFFPLGGKVRIIELRAQRSEDLRPLIPTIPARSALKNGVSGRGEKGKTWRALKPFLEKRIRFFKLPLAFARKAGSCGQKGSSLMLSND